MKDVPSAHATGPPAHQFRRPYNEPPTGAQSAGPLQSAPPAQLPGCHPRPAAGLVVLWRPDLPDSPPANPAVLMTRLREVDRSPRGPLVHVWSADSQPRTISLGTGLSCYANHSICSPEAIYLVRECPPQTASDHAIGHATGTSGLE
jgi:hypothetical protein